MLRIKAATSNAHNTLEHRNIRMATKSKATLALEPGPVWLMDDVPLSVQARRARR